MEYGKKKKKINQFPKISFLKNIAPCSKQKKKSSGRKTLKAMLVVQ